MMKRNGRWLLVGLLMLGACKEAYRPDLKSTAERYLVVEGVLNAGNGPTTITLNRTAPLDGVGPGPEANANVTVEGKDNSVRTLAYMSGSNYSSPNLGLVIGNEYRLRIRTTNGKEYLSSWVKAVVTPDIDSVSWKRTPEGVQFYANTHDPANATRFYRWDFDETWEIRAYYASFYIYNKITNTVRLRTSPELVLTCWKYGFSNTISLASTERLQQDVVSEAPIHFIINNDERLCVRYSMLLRQYALDKEGYEFYQLMKRNTESLGSIFDAQPTQVKGNITCVTDPTEQVIGYVAASTISEKRMFISNGSLPGWRLPEYCPDMKIKNDPDSLLYYFGPGAIKPYYAIFNNMGVEEYFTASSAACVDCTERGGSTAKPSYW